jgi:hypothetical protein
MPQNYGGTLQHTQAATSIHHATTRSSDHNIIQKKVQYSAECYSYAVCYDTLTLQDVKNIVYYSMLQIRAAFAGCSACDMVQTR